MTMVFNVKDRFMLDKLQPSDKVEFKVVNEGVNSQCPSSKSFADRLCAAPAMRPWPMQSNDPRLFVAW